MAAASEWHRSQHCESSGCVEVTWRKSSHSGADGCVEVADAAGSVLVRDSKDPDGPYLVFTAEEWRTFVDGIGELDARIRPVS